MTDRKKDDRIFKHEIHQFSDGSIGYAELTLDTDITVGQVGLGEAVKVKDNLSKEEVDLIKRKGTDKIRLKKDKLTEE